MLSAVSSVDLPRILSIRPGQKRCQYHKPCRQSCRKIIEKIIHFRRVFQNKDTFHFYTPTSNPSCSLPYIKIPVVHLPEADTEAVRSLHRKYFPQRSLQPPSSLLQSSDFPVSLPTIIETAFLDPGRSFSFNRS